MRIHSKTASWVAGLALGTLVLAGCSDDGGNGAEPGAEEISFWTPHVTPERLAIQEDLAAQFEEQTGIAVEVVPLEGTDQNQALVTGAASGNVPDVILHAADQTASWRDQGLLDTDVAAQIVESLDASTFTEAAVEQVSMDGEIGAVPSDGWTHLIVYRTDLFDEAGVSVPTSLAELAEAATDMTDTGVTGIAMGTEVGTPSSTEATESILQTGGCELFTDGQVTFDSPECIEALGHFKTLADSGQAGTMDVEAAQAAYLNGSAAMLLFSTHILDEIAGLDPNNPPTCTECGDNPAFLAENSDFITVLDESNAAQYGSVLAYGVPTGANATEAQQFIEFMLGDGYVENVGTATEGRIPLRPGTPEDPEAFLTEWGELRFGADLENELSIADVYGDDVVDALRDGSSAVSRWGFGTPDATVAGAAFAQHVVSSHLDSLYSGTDPADVAAAVAADLEDLQAEYGSS